MDDEQAKTIERYVELARATNKKQQEAIGWRRRSDDQI